MAKIPSTDPRGSLLEQAARQLLRVAQHVTSVESTFVTSIDWRNHRQDVLYSLNGGGLALAEGTSVDWHAALCRSILRSEFAQAQRQTDHAGQRLPGAYRFIRCPDI